MKRIFIILVLGILTLFLNSCICNRNYCKIEPMSHTKHLIEKDTAEKIQKNFFINQEQVRMGNPIAIGNERSDFWFPAKELSSYLCLTQETAKDNEYEISGYRMYLGADTNPDGTIGKYKLFIVPTIKTSTSPKANIKMMKTGGTVINADEESVLHQDDTNFKPFDISGSGNPRFEFHAN